MKRQIFIMRHGQAHLWAATDDVRPLTLLGEMQSEAMAKIIHQAIDGAALDLVLVSPYLRAQQTWQACQRQLAAPSEVITEKSITPYGDSERVAMYINALMETKPYQNILVISHLPLVGYLTAELDARISAPAFPTSAVACLDYRLNQATFEWLQVPE